MEKNIMKPNLDLEVEVKVNGVTKLENNMTDVKELALKLQEFYKTTKFIEDGTKIDFEDEEQMKSISEKRDVAKSEKVKVNNFKKAINEKCKEALDIYNKPIEKFEKLKKETVAILTETYEAINLQVDLVDSQLLAKKKEKFKSYFGELAVKENIDFITYEDMKQNVTLSASIKSLREEINMFISKICDELKLIATEEHQAEILVEYKKSLNVANAITTVKIRIKEIEEAKRLDEERKLKIQKNQINIIKVEDVIEQGKVEEIQIIESKENIIDEIFTTTFKVKSTKVKLLKLKEFLINGGYDYE